MIRAGGLTYWQIKCRALNGGRSKLDADQLGFVGIYQGESPQAEVEGSVVTTWSHVNVDARIAEAEEELARLRDIAPGWFRLAREIVNDDDEK